LTIKYFQFKYQNDSAGNKKPYHNHLVIETSAGILYMIPSNQIDKFYGSNDKGVTWTELDVDPTLRISPNNIRIADVDSCWHDRTNKILYFLDCESTGNLFDTWKFDYSGGWGSEVTTEMGIEAGDHYTFDILKVGGDKLVITWDDPVTAVLDAINVNVIPHVSEDDIVLTCRGRAAIIVYDGDDPVVFALLELTGSNIIQFYKLVTAGGYVWSSVPYSGDGDTRPVNYSIPPKNQAAIAYDGSDIFYFVLQKDSDSKFYLWSYSRDAEIFAEISEFNVVLMADRNNDNSGDTPNLIEKAFELDGTKIYKLLRTRAGLGLFQDITNDPDFTAGSTIVAITDNFLFVDNNGTIEIWEQKEIIGDVEFSKGELRGDIKFASNQIIELYDDDTEL